MRRYRILQQVASITFLLVLSTIIRCSVATRSSIFKIEAEDMSHRSLRGNPSRSRRLRVPSQDRALKDESYPERSLFVDPSVLGMIGGRRSNAIDAIRHTDEMLLALRFSMGQDTSMSPTPVSAL